MDKKINVDVFNCMYSELRIMSIIQFFFKEINTDLFLFCKCIYEYIKIILKFT